MTFRNDKMEHHNSGSHKHYTDLGVRICDVKDCALGSSGKKMDSKKNVRERPRPWLVNSLPNQDMMRKVNGDKDKLNHFFCGPCQVSVQKKEHFDMHLNGKRHKNAVMRHDEPANGDMRPPINGILPPPDSSYWKPQRGDYNWQSSYPLGGPAGPQRFQTNRTSYNRPRPGWKRSSYHPRPFPPYIPPPPPQPPVHKDPPSARPTSPKPPKPSLTDENIEPQVDNLLNTLRYNSSTTAANPSPASPLPSTPASPTTQEEQVTQPKDGEDTKEEETANKEAKEPTPDTTTKEDNKKEGEEIEVIVLSDDESDDDESSRPIIIEEIKKEVTPPKEDTPVINIQGRTLDNINITIQNEAQRKVQVCYSATPDEPDSSSLKKKSSNPAALVHKQQQLDSKLMKNPKVLLRKLEDLPLHSYNLSSASLNPRVTTPPVSKESVPEKSPKEKSSASNPPKSDNPSTPKSQPSSKTNPKKISSGPLSSKAVEKTPNPQPPESHKKSNPKQSSVVEESDEIEIEQARVGSSEREKPPSRPPMFDRKKVSDLINNKSNRKGQLLLQNVMKENALLRGSFKPSQKLVSEVAAKDVPRNLFTGLLKELEKETKNSGKKSSQSSGEETPPPSTETPIVKQEPMNCDEDSSKGGSEAMADNDLIAPSNIKKEPTEPLPSTSQAFSKSTSIPASMLSETQRIQEFFLNKGGSVANPAPEQPQQTTEMQSTVEPAAVPSPPPAELPDDPPSLHDQLIELSRMDNDLLVQAQTVQSYMDQLNRLQHSCLLRLGQIREKQSKMSSQRLEIIEKLKSLRPQPLPPTPAELMDTQTLIEQLWASMPPDVSGETASDIAKRKKKPPAKPSTAKKTTPSASTSSAAQDQPPDSAAAESTSSLLNDTANAVSKGKRKQPFEDTIFDEVAAKLQALDNPDPSSSRPRKIAPVVPSVTSPFNHPPCLNQQLVREEEQQSVVFHKEKVFGKGITCIKVHNGSVFAGGLDSYVLRISLGSTADRTEYRGHLKQITGIAVTEKWVFTISLDCLLRKFNVKTGRLEDTHNLVHPIICLTHNWNLIYLGLNNGLVVPFDIERNRCLDALHCSEKPVCQVVTTTAGAQRLLCVSSSDLQVTVWDLTSGLLLRCMEGTMEPPCSLLMMGTHLLASSSAEKLLHVHDIESGKVVRKVKWFAKCTGLALLGNTFVVAAFNKGRVNFYHQTNFAYYAETYGADRDGISSLEVSGNFVFTGNQNGWLESLYFRDDIKPTPCMNGTCGSRFFLLRDFLYHFNNQHYFRITAKMEKCPWRPCKVRWTQTTSLAERQTHVVGHITLS